MLLSQLRGMFIKADLAMQEDIEITSITSDSRTVQPGSLFVAIRGFTVDGHHFLQDAEAKGAVAVMVEEGAEGLSIPQLVVPDTKFASARLADYFFQHPSHRLRVIGVTGTNGKTTTTHLIEHILGAHGFRTGLLGTVGKRIAGRTADVANTTPNAIELQASLHEMVKENCQYGIMEVSSHALDERRDAGTRYRAAVFTNLTQDHLDYHGTMENYRAAKAKLFARLGNAYGDRENDAYAVLNADDPASAFFAEQTVAECITYGIQNAADVQATNVEIEPDGARFHVDSFKGCADFQLKLTGRFNVYNALAAISVGLVEGIPLSDIASYLSEMPGVPGRFEPVVAGQTFTVLVDYSHTPDSLENALNTVREFAKGRIVTVVGCGGDRDKTKRPIMAEVATRLSDFTILTSDNPRTENPESILDDMEEGIRSLPKGAARTDYMRLSDRREAIHVAVQYAKPGDVVLIAGKGHETYQIFGRTKTHFDDREVAREAISSKHMP